jgi:hypothetical protein
MKIAILVVCLMMSLNALADESSTSDVGCNDRVR